MASEWSIVVACFLAAADEQIALIEEGVRDLVDSTFVDGQQCIFLTRVPEDEASGNYVYVEDNDACVSEKCHKLWFCFKRACKQPCVSQKTNNNYRSSRTIVRMYNVLFLLNVELCLIHTLTGARLTSE